MTTCEHFGTPTRTLRGCREDSLLLLQHVKMLSDFQIFQHFDLWPERMELFGRIVDRMEFGVPRQKLFVRVRPKVVHNARCVARAEDSFVFFSIAGSIAIDL